MAKRILIADDNSAMRNHIRTCLESCPGFAICQEAVDGMEAIHMARQEKPDLIVLDLCMPGLNGLEAAAILKCLLPSVPIILFTLHKEIVTEKQAKASGISSVISKTAQVEELLQEAQRLTAIARSTSA